MKKLIIAFAFLLMLTIAVHAESVSTTMVEGSTQSYTLNGQKYETTVVFVSDPIPGNTTPPVAKLSINGELTDALGTGQSYTMRNGLTIKILDVLMNAREGVASFTLDAGTATPQPTTPPALPDSITLTMNEGQSTVVTLGAQRYDFEVTLVYVSDMATGVLPNAKLSINGELSPALEPMNHPSAQLQSGVRVDMRTVNANQGIATFVLTLSPYVAPPTPTYCVYGGQRYASGESWKASCNTCSCNDGRILCTSITCPAPTPVPTPVCEYNGQTYSAGSSWAADCNTCSCTDSGRVICTMRACPAPCTGSDCTVSQSQQFITVVSKADATATDIQRFLQEKGYAIQRSALTDAEVYRTYTSVPADKIFILVRDHNVLIIMGEQYVNSYTPEIHKTVTALGEFLKAKRFSVETKLSSEVTMDVFKPEGTDGRTIYPGKQVLDTILVGQTNHYTTPSGQKWELSAVAVMNNIPVPPTAAEITGNTDTRVGTATSAGTATGTAIRYDPYYDPSARYAVQFTLNGEATRYRMAGQTATLSNGATITVNSIEATARGTQVSYSLQIPSEDAIRIEPGKPYEDTMQVGSAKAYASASQYWKVSTSYLRVAQPQTGSAAQPRSGVIFSVNDEDRMIGQDESYTFQSGVTIRLTELLQADSAPYVRYTITAQSEPNSVCTSDAKECPDGTWVGRSGPDCEFKCGTVPPTACQNGCSVDGRCLPLGTRVANGDAQYCDLSGRMTVQKADDSACQNNYECVSNQCLNAVCKSLDKKIDQSASRMEGFFSWLRGIFGGPAT